MTQIKKISNHTFAAHLDDGRVYVLSNAVDGSLASAAGEGFIYGKHDWEALPQSVGGYKIVPYGWNNDTPGFIRDMLADNNLAPGILGRQKGLMWGQGPQLFRNIFQDGKIVQEWVEDREVTAWLRSWNYEEYLLGIIEDFLCTGGYFDAKHLTKGSRLSSIKRIGKIEHIKVENARLEWPDPDTGCIKDCRHIIVGDFGRNPYPGSIQVYPVFDRNNPGAHPVAASYHQLGSFGRSFYSIPQFWGAVRWIIRGSEIPTIFKYVTENGINLAYHVHSPESYWQNRREILQALHPDWTPAQVEEEIQNITRRMLDNMTRVLTGKQNAGKMFHSVDCLDDTGTERSWKIEAIDQKIKDFVDSQLKIAEASVSAITSGMGLHPSLSNIMVNGKLASGSEMLYAFKLYLASDTAIPTMLIMASINDALQINWPEKGLQLGFYHASVKTEESLSAGDRIKNN